MNSDMDYKKSIKYDIKNICIIIPTTILVALGLWVFVYKSDFAPSGVDGLATVLQYLTKVNAGIFTFAINLPLLVAAWFILKKRYVIYTLIYTGVLSVSILLFEKFGVYQYEDNDVLAAIFAGVAQGITGLLLKIGGSSGGVDIIGCMIQKKMPHRNVETVIAFLSYIIVLVGFIVYGNLHSALLSIIEIVVCEKVTALILKDRRNAVKFEIIVDRSQTLLLKETIIYELKHGATIIKAEGAFSEGEKDILVCLVSYRQIAELLNIVKSVDGAFVYYSDVMGVHGNFDWRLEEEKESDLNKRKNREKRIEKKAKVEE